jgi:two-component system chemotaxis response regulator CheB
MQRPASSPPRDDAAGAAPRPVLIVDDSVVARAVVGRLIEASGRWTVACAVPSVDAALAFLAQNAVDFILLDIHMPGIDGLSGLPDLLAAAPGAKVIVVSSAAAAGVQALALGAADALTKPGPSCYSNQFGVALLAALRRLGDGGAPRERVAVARPSSVAVRPPVVAEQVAPAQGSAYDVIAIGASTGGIHALSGLIRELPASLRVPILVTQHLPATFMPYFAAQLAVLAGRPCDVATDRMRIRQGRLIVAPGDAHLQIVALNEGGSAIRLSRAPSISGCMPSVDPMLASLAAVHGERALAVMLSGMGRDGLDGARAVHAAGGSVVAQDCATSVVWGMPGAVVAAGITDAVLTPQAIGILIASGKRA